MKARLPTPFLLLTAFSFAAIEVHASTLTVRKLEDTNDGVCDAELQD